MKAYEVIVDGEVIHATVDESLAMPIQDLHTEACLTGSPVFENDFPDSRLIKPVSEEQTRLRNVLFAPMVLEGKALGLSNRIRSIKFTTEGTENQTVGCFSRIKRDMAKEELSSGTTRQAPADHARNMSCTLRSKVRSKICVKRSSVPKSN